MTFWQLESESKLQLPNFPLNGNSACLLSSFFFCLSCTLGDNSWSLFQGPVNSIADDIREKDDGSRAASGANFVEELGPKFRLSQGSGFNALEKNRTGNVAIDDEATALDSVLPSVI